MPELPDITIYIEALEKRILGQTLERVRVVSPFLLRTATPPLGGATGKKVLRLRRVGKRICIGLEGDQCKSVSRRGVNAGLFCRWRRRAGAPPAKKSCVYAASGNGFALASKATSGSFCI